VRRIGETELLSLAAGLPPGARVVASGNFAAPHSVLDRLDKACQQFVLHMLNAQPGIPARDGIGYETCFVGPAMRDSAALHYVPARLSLLPELFGSTLRPDVVVLHTSPPVDGYVSLGIEVNVLPAAVEAARRHGGIVIAQVNPRMPYTYGDAELPVELVDYGFEAEEGLRTVTPSLIDDTAGVIGERIGRRIGSGATLQLGIGSVPDAALRALLAHRRLKVWSEMVSDGVLGLERRGVLDVQVPITASFMFGSDELYAWAHRNPRLRMQRTETTNDPSRIAAQVEMVSINSALQVDLFAQVNAARRRSRIYSGFGGQTDFVVGALHSHGGQALIALRSWHPKAKESSIVPMVEEPVTSFQPTSVITEQGVAELLGRDERVQAANLIEHAAHPRVREELWEEAAALGLA